MKKKRKNKREKEAKKSLHEKEIVTTGEAARLLPLSQQTIIRCFDSGKLKGFRVPGSRFRRIPRKNLDAFAAKHNIPINSVV